MILSLISAQRCQTLEALLLHSMSCVDDKYVFYFNYLLKTSRPGKLLEPLIVFQMPSYVGLNSLPSTLEEQGLSEVMPNSCYLVSKNPLMS